MNTPKREINPVITFQRESHLKIVSSLKDRNKHLESKNAELSKQIEILLYALRKAERRLNPDVTLSEQDVNVSELHELIKEAIKTATT